MFCGLLIVLHLDAGTAAGIGAGSLTQTSMMGTASGALSAARTSRGCAQAYQGNIAAGYAVTYICGYILVLLFVPLVAPRLMGVNLKEEATKLEAELSGGAPPKPGNLLYRKFQARAYQVSVAAGQTVGEIEDSDRAARRRRAHSSRLAKISRSAVRYETTGRRRDSACRANGRDCRGGADHRVRRSKASTSCRSVPGDVLEVFVTARDLHGRTLGEIVDRLGDQARGVFLRSLTRHGQEVPITPGTRIYVGDVMTLVGLNNVLKRVVPQIGQPFSSTDRTDIAFLASGLAVGLLVGLFSVSVGSIPLTLGGGGGALVAGLICGWLRSRRPTMGAFPPAAQQSLIDVGLGGFVAAIGLGSGSAAWAAIQANGPMLLGAGVVVTLTPLIVGTLFAHRVLHMNPVIVCGALAGAMTVDAAVTGSCEVAESQTPVLGVAVPYAIANVLLTVLGPIIVGLTFAA